MMRRDMLAASLAALTVAPIVAQAAQPDPILDLCAQYQHAYDMMEVALANDTGVNFDSPECDKWSSEKDRLMKVIEVTPIKSREGLAAFCAFIWTDADADGCEWLDIQRWALAKMRDYAEARALVGV